MDLSAKDCLVTGASSGLGLAVSKKLAKMGAHVILLCRDSVKGETAMQYIKTEIPDASIELMLCDLASMASIRQFIEQFKTTHTKLDLLFNNAAVMKRKRQVNEDGFEMMFQVNYLAPFILMNAFAELLRSASDAQVLNNTLPSYKYRIDLDDLQSSRSYSMYDSFFRTKLCLLFATLEFAKQHEDDSITTFMAVPGTFKSDLVRETPLFGWFKNLFSAPVEHAAENIIYVITTDALKNKNAKAFKEREEWPLSEYWQDATVRERLWSLTESLIRNTALDNSAQKGASYSTYQTTRRLQ